VETVFWSFQFYGPECQKSTRTKPLVLTEAILSKGLAQSKTLDRRDSGVIKLIALLELHNLTVQVGCMEAELVLLPKQKL